MYLLPDTKAMKTLYKQLLKLLKVQERYNQDTKKYEGTLRIGASGDDRTNWDWYLNGEGEDNTASYLYIIELDINSGMSFDQFNELVHLRWQQLFY